MSPLLITGLIIAALVVLMIIGYINHMVDNSKLEKARKKAEFADRVRRCYNVSESFPGQFMTPPLKLALSRIELQYSERLLPFDKQNSALRERIAELQQMITRGEDIAVRNLPQAVLTEANAKDVRFILEDLHGVITRAAQEHLYPANEAKNWIQEIRHMLVQLHYEFFTNLGQQAMQKGQPGQARLAYERGVQYLRKQPDPSRYKSQLKVLEQQLARANAVVLEAAAPAVEEASELTDGLKSLDENDWKKKNIYD
ncbi:hypothetical protein IB229_01235 [Pseudomonas sp. PDM14]|uniref:hypothetical protein n=1 Tax=Pseudomonas sp. PDM14 TaxID=2769288 RepID=UPI00177E8A66|nr:hypothetical protein [Pseudomonas sp. PDM14]MBD9481579.1 hypothetical protein [Pseudomonas sp. PDM14]